MNKLRRGAGAADGSGQVHAPRSRFGGPWGCAVKNFQLNQADVAETYDDCGGPCLKKGLYKTMKRGCIYTYICIYIYTYLPLYIQQGSRMCRIWQPRCGHGDWGIAGFMGIRFSV